MTFPMWGPPPPPEPQALKVEVLPTERPLIYMSIGYQQRVDPQTSYLSPAEARRLAALLLEAADQAGPDKQEQP